MYSTPHTLDPLGVREKVAQFYVLYNMYRVEFQISLLNAQNQVSATLV